MTKVHSSHAPPGDLSNKLTILQASISDHHPAAWLGAAGDIYVGQALVLDSDLDLVEERPLWVPRHKLQLMHTRGTPGSGKTSRTLLLLFYQLIECTCLQSQPPELNCQRRRDRACNIMIDLGGDTNLGLNLKRFTEAAGATFRLFTLDSAYQSETFPLCQAFDSPIIASEITSGGWHLDVGLAYGGAYYAAQGQIAMLEAGREIAQQGGTFEIRRLKKTLDRQRKRFKDAEMVRLITNVLSDYEQLGPSLDPETTIDLERAIDDGETLYFHLPTLELPHAARWTAGTILYSLAAVIVRRKKKGKPKRIVNAGVDEFQEIVGHSADALLAQLRKYSCNLLLANQSTDQLDNHKDLKLSGTIFSSSTAKIYHTCIGRDDIDDLQWLSSEVSKKVGGGSRRGFEQTLSYREEMRPSLDRNTILRVSNTPGWCFVVAGGEPIIVRQDQFFDDLSNEALPLCDDNVHERRSEGGRPETVSGHLLTKGIVESDPWQVHLAALWEELVSLERWELLSDPTDEVRSDE